MVNDDERLDRTFQALSDRTRRAILTRLCRGEATVSELAQPFEMSMPAITKHLNVLEAAGLIERRRDGRMKRCRLEPEGIQTVRGWLERQARFWDQSLDRLDRFLEAEDARRDG